MLEPIDESELNLKSKFLAGEVVKSEKPENVMSSKSGSEINLASEAVPSPEVREQKEGQMERDSAYDKILAKVKNSSTVIHNDVSSDARIANDELDYENKIINLVGLAQLKGVAHAVKVAQHMEDNYLLDELHDRLLAQELHDALVKKGMITEI